MVGKMNKICLILVFFCFINHNMFVKGMSDMEYSKEFFKESNNKMCKVFIDDKRNIHVTIDENDKKLTRKFIDTNVISFVVTKECTVIYSKWTGGVFIYNTKEKGKELLSKGLRTYYSSLFLGPEGSNKIYGVKYDLKIKPKEPSLNKVGIGEIDLRLKSEKLLIPRVVDKEGKVIFNPEIDSISEDGRVIYLRDNDSIEGKEILGTYEFENNELNYNIY